jgi:hypothetical protein
VRRARSGIGIAVGGANGLVVRHNAILRNTPGGETAFKGGVVIVRGDAGTAPADNRVRRNLILGNDPDLFWDGSGTGNVLQPNVCRTSQPAGLCG